MELAAILRLHPGAYTEMGAFSKHFWSDSIQPGILDCSVSSVCQPIPIHENEQEARREREQAKERNETDRRCKVKH